MKKEDLTKILHALINAYEPNEALTLFEHILHNIKSDCVSLKALRLLVSTHPEHPQIELD